VRVSGQAQRAKLATIARTDGTRQVTYAGHPLYYYVGDTKPGEANGQGLTDFGARWSLVTPAGKPVTAGSSSSNSGHGGGGGGW
jgi:hypothetical protein